MEMTEQPDYSNNILNARWAIRDARLATGTSLLVLSALVDRMDSKKRDFTCYPSLAQLTEDTGLCKSTIQRCVQVLESGGWLRVRRVPDHNNVYHLNLKPILARAQMMREQKKALRAIEPLPDPVEDIEDIEDVTEPQQTADTPSPAPQAKPEEASVTDSGYPPDAVAELKKLVFPELQRIFHEHPIWKKPNAWVMISRHVIDCAAGMTEDGFFGVIYRIEGREKIRRKVATAANFGAYFRTVFMQQVKELDRETAEETRAGATPPAQVEESLGTYRMHPEEENDDSMDLPLEYKPFVPDEEDL